MKDNITNLVEFKNSKEITEAGMKSIKEDYMEPQLSEEQLKKLKMKIQEAKADNRKEKIRTLINRFATTAAVIVIAFIALPNMSPSIAYAIEKIPVVGSLVKVAILQNYDYEDEQHRADVDIPELVVDIETQSGQHEVILENVTAEINAEMQAIIDGLLAEFVKHIQEEAGYKELIVKSEVLVTTPDYFTLRLSCYQGEASGYTQDYFYTISLTSKERLQLKDIFIENADYIHIISENIKEQMRNQMDQDENIYYWLEDEIDELNFKTISEKTSFYINEKNNVVICFNQGEVAAMYMGGVEFEIPAEVLNDIRK